MCSSDLLLLWVAALLLPLDVAIRRLMIRKEDLAPAWAAVRNAAGRLRPQRVEEPETVGALLQSRRAAREEQTEPFRPPIPTMPPPVERESAAEVRPEPPAEQPREEPAVAQAPPAEEEAGGTTSLLLKRKRELRGEDE